METAITISEKATKDAAIDLQHVLHSNNYKRIIEYYEDAGPDYEEWSRNFNMHFGYGNWLNIFNREKMLERMNLEVLRRLNLTSDKKE